jgi:hypothetical protein
VCSPVRTSSCQPSFMPLAYFKVLSTLELCVLCDCQFLDVFAGANRAFLDAAVPYRITARGDCVIIKLMRVVAMDV